ncbi:MAG: replicative DNA helicase [Actinomycetota bacterium]|nr:replicative DNA helicase [Actinomycetota bacterium]
MERIPPYNIEAEESLLGAMLISREAIGQVIEIVIPGSFYRKSNQTVYQAIIELFSKGEPVDPITLADCLEKKGQLEQVGGKTFIHSLISNVPLASNASYYAQIVNHNHILRRLIYAATEIATMGYEVPDNLSSTIDKAQQLVFSVYQDYNQGKDSSRISPMKDILSEVYEQVEKLYEHKSDIIGIPTGFIDLDKKTSGLQNSDLIVVAARPGMGKTSFALCLAKHVAMEEKYPVAIFSLEMSKHQIAQRLLCAEARIDLHRLRSGNLRDDEWPKLARSIEKLAESQLFIDDTAFLTVMDLRSRARMLVSTYGIKLLIVDYLQLMGSGLNYRDNRVLEITEISRNLKGIAKELNIPVIAISQLSREVEKRESKRPALADLRESGAIEQDADIVIFIYRDEYYDEKSKDQGIAEINIAKHRNGPTAKLSLNFYKEYALFRNLTKVNETN